MPRADFQESRSFDCAVLPQTPGQAAVLAGSCQPVCQMCPYRPLRSIISPKVNGGGLSPPLRTGSSTAQLLPRMLLALRIPMQAGAEGQSCKTGIQALLLDGQGELSLTCLCLPCHLHLRIWPEHLPPPASIQLHPWHPPPSCTERKHHAHDGPGMADNSSIKLHRHGRGELTHAQGSWSPLWPARRLPGFPAPLGCKLSLMLMTGPHESCHGHALHSVVSQRHHIASCPDVSL